MVRWAADGVLVLHLLFIAFAVFGGLALLWSRRWVFVHLPALLWAVFVESTGRVCPLTPLENLWRQRAGQDGYAGGFVEHYLIPLIYPAGLTPRLQLALAALVVGINFLVYGIVAARRRRGRRHAVSAPGAAGPT